MRVCLPLLTQLRHGRLRTFAPQKHCSSFAKARYPPLHGHDLPTGGSHGNPHRPAKIHSAARSTAVAAPLRPHPELLLAAQRDMLLPAFTHASRQLLQASAQIRQCSCLRACFSHSAPHKRQAAAQASSIRRIIASSELVLRVAMRPVILQMSAQSRLSRIHCLSSSTIFSARHASAHDVHVCAQE
jgi:hypothetical protein